MKYKTVNGTAYHKDTKPEVIRLLERFRESQERIRLWHSYNNKNWNNEYHTIGMIGRSTGQYKIPLLIDNKRSTGGISIAEEHIVRIDTNRNGIKETVYIDKSIQFDLFIGTDTGNVYNRTKRELYTKCKNGDSGKRLAAFMNGERWNK